MTRLLHWIGPPLAILLLIGVFMYTRGKINQQPAGPPPKTEKAAIASDVAVTTVTPQAYSAKISGFGEAEAHYSLSLTAQVSGQVKSVSPSFESGHILRKGELLLQLDATEYTAAVAAAKSDLAQNRLSLLEEERQVKQAQAEWASSGMTGQPDSELVLRAPQLAAAKALVENSQAALDLAEENLAKTEIRAPFDCLIVSRDISPGSYLQAGTTTAALYSIDRVEIPIKLSSKEWDTLPDEASFTGTPVTLTAVDNGRRWQGEINRVERQVDTETRQRTVVIAVETPFSLTSPLLPGTFVRADIEGRMVDNLWQLPASALSQRGEIWYVTDGRLNKFSAETVFSYQNTIFISVPEQLRTAEQQVVNHPLSSYLTGMEVRPREEKDNAQPE